MLSKEFLEKHEKYLLKNSQTILQKLSPNVVIYHILTFVSVNPLGTLAQHSKLGFISYFINVGDIKKINRIVNPFELFGYFKNDRSRHVWYVFPSLEIANYAVSGYLINKRKVTLMNFNSIKNVIPKSYKKNVFWGVKVLILNRLEKGNGDVLLRLNHFPNLELLEIHDSYRGTTGINWNVNNFEKLRSFSVESSNWIDEIFRKCQMDELRKIEFKSTRTVTGIGWKYFKNLRIFEINSTWSDYEFEKKFSWYFKKYEFEHLERIILQRAGLISIRGWKTMISLSTLVFDHCILSEDFSFFSLDIFPNLKSLSLLQLEKSSTFHISRFSLSKVIQTLIIVGCESISNELFLVNEFDALLNLTIKKCIRINGVEGEWKRMPKLKTLVIGHPVRNTYSSKHGDSNALVDRPFALGAFGSIESFEFSDNILVEGKDWGKMMFLKEMTLRENKITDVLFQKEGMFPVLQALHLQTCKEIEGKKWSELSELKKMTVVGCDLICDDFLVETSLPKLEDLEVNNCKSIKGGKEWKFEKLKRLAFGGLTFSSDFLVKNVVCPKLEILFLRECHDCYSGIMEKIGESFQNVKKLVLKKLNNLNDKFFSMNNFGNVTELTLDDVTRVTGNSWNQLPKLRKLVLKDLLNYEDFFFSGLLEKNEESKMNLDDLEILEVRGTKFLKLYGRKWRKMKSLKKFYASRSHLGHFRKEFFENLPFLENCYIDVD